LEAWFVQHPHPRGIVLMFPGYAGVKEAFLTPAAHLYQFGYSSLLVDFRGSGGSSGNDTTLGLREADDVAATFVYAQQHWPGLPIISHQLSHFPGCGVRPGIDSYRLKYLVLDLCKRPTFQAGLDFIDCADNQLIAWLSL